MSGAARWVVLIVAGALVGVEWARAPGWVWIVAAGIVTVGLVLVHRWSAAALAGARWPARAAVGGATVLGVALTVSGVRLHRVTVDWPAQREAALLRASQRLGGALDEARRLASRLADEAAAVATTPAPLVFSALDALTAGGGAMRGAVLFDADGRPRAWAGVQRAALAATGPALEAVTSPFYLWLVARRQTSMGTAVAAVALARDGAAPAAGLTVGDAFQRHTGVGLTFFADAATAPRAADVFDYLAPDGDTLFAVRPAPPEQGPALESTLRGARRLVLGLAALLLVLAAAVQVRVGLGIGWTVGVGLAALAAIGRAPLHEAFGPGSAFWPDTMFQPLLGPWASSSGALLLSGTVVFGLACALWRRGLPRRHWRMAVAVVIASVAPYLLQSLARGMSPPARGVTPALWLTWQAALAVPASALVLLAVALVRGAREPDRAGVWPWLAGAIAVAAATAGLWLWQPVGRWPEWYPFLWVPAVLLTLRPMPLRSAIAVTAVVAGSSAALLAWGAANEGRVALAEQDLEGLGERPDPLAVALLDRFVRDLPTREAPATAAQLLALWRHSALGAQGYPAALAVWRADGARTPSVALAVLDLPDTLLGRLAREAAAVGLPVARPALRVPGVHGIAAVPLNGGVLTVAVGPRSLLVPPTRLGQFLAGAADDPDPPYALALAPPGRRVVALDADIRWSRDGWSLRAERRVPLADGDRHAHAVVDLRRPAALLQRGALSLALDVALMVLLWAAVEVLAGRAAPALRRWAPSVAHSLRIRLSVSLALFFIIPVVAFAAWSLDRLEAEFRGARTLLLQRALRDAAAIVARDTADPAAAVGAAAQRLDAELYYARNGELVGASAPLLVDLGLLDRLLPGPAYVPLAWGDELELTLAQRAAPAPTLVAYRLLDRPALGEAGVLATPEIFGERALRRREADLAVAVLVAGLLGMLAAAFLSGAAARALAEPLHELRREALAVADGAVPSGRTLEVPVELRPIRAALAQAARDVEASQRAQRVLAWGEMARQVAHEIKNPLTPIRLGVQHLLRLQRERPAELPAALAPTGERILAEIERLDAIARGFSRLAPPSAQALPLERVDVTAVVREVAALYAIGSEPPAWRIEGPDGVLASARRDELVEVLVNLTENARDAGARTVTARLRPADGASPASLELEDDGRGIAEDLLPRVFEPRFSTTTSGTGLGLAIARRLVESWGGRITLTSQVRSGTTVRIAFASVVAT
jgi:signal transduction histidine kinase